MAGLGDITQARDGDRATVIAGHPTTTRRRLGHSMRSEVAQSPRIRHISWGRMEVDGLGTGRDFKLYPGGGRAWDWAETGTHHKPGILPADVQELLDHGATTVVLSRGMERQLHTSPEARQILADRGIAVYIEETRAAVDLYNRLAETELVGGLFHSTC